jgi:protoporphyrinogen oxidase
LADNEKIVVLGAGVGGLAVGYFLTQTGKYHVTVLEKAPVIGGLCATFEHNGFKLDYGAHKLYSVIPGILDEIRDLMGERLLELPKKNRLFLRGQLVDYPLRLGNLAKALGLGTFLRLGFGYGVEFMKGLFDKSPPSSYEDYIVRRFGHPTYELVFEPLADKVWGDPATLHPEMARTRVPASGGLDVALKLLGLKKETAETNAEFFYYPRKGFGDWPQALAEKIEENGGSILRNVDITALRQADGKIIAVEADVDGKQSSFTCDYVVSSIPLPVVGNMVFGKKDVVFSQAVQGLQFRHLILVYIFLDRDLVMDDQWIFFPQKDVVFSRLFEQKQMNPELGPMGSTVVTADFTTTENSELWRASDEELSKKVIEGLVHTGMISADEVTDHHVIKYRNFYPRYDQEYAEKMMVVSDKLRQVSNLLTTGRIGMYNYNNSDHCADMGRFIAENLSAGVKPTDIWQRLELRVADYVIVD